MSKSATEQFQIKKKRKYPHGGSASPQLELSAPALDGPPTQQHSRLASKRLAPHQTGLASAAPLVPEHFAEFHIGDKQLRHALHFKPITLDDGSAEIFLDAIYLAAGPPPDDKHAQTTVATAATGTDCLRDHSQVRRRLRDSHSLPSNASSAAATPIAIAMPLQHGFYVKGALASKRALKSLAGHRATASPHPAEEASAKRARRTLTTSSAPDSAKTRSSDMQLSYVLGESLARHARLQEAFDLYALIASQQLECSITLEKLNVLATALMEHVRGLSTHCKKASLDATPETVAVESLQLDGDKFGKSSSGATSSALASAWQLEVASLNAVNPFNAKSLAPDAPMPATGGGPELHNPTRELARSKSVSPQDDYDPLTCPLCRDVLRCPVTANCGHTFCRQCCETITMCNICHIKFPRWQTDDLASEASSAQLALTTLTTVTSTCTSTSSLAAATPLQLPQFQQRPMAGISSTPSRPEDASPAMRLRIMAAPSAHGGAQSAASSPTTVTTTSIACTTDTATTTMASTTSSLPKHQASSGGRGICGGGGGGGSDHMKFMPDVLVRRLVEKWWGPDLMAKKILETATSYMHLNLLDDALKGCNASLEKAPSNFKSLLLRAEVLRKMNHYQSSLADIDNALKSRYTSAKAHYLRSLALSELGRHEEALYEICLAISLDKSTNLSSTELFQHDLTKILQKLLSQAPKSIKLDLLAQQQQQQQRSKCPYNFIIGDHRLRRKNVAAVVADDEALLNPYDDEDFLCATYGKECDILMADEDVLSCTDFHNCADKRATYASIAKKYEMEWKTSRKHFRRKWLHKTEPADLLPTQELEGARCSGQFRNVLERLQQEIVRLKKLETSPEYAARLRLTVPNALIDASDFDCVLCCRTLWKPVVTPCGHTYCLVCLDRCMYYTSACPLCMSPLVETAGMAGVGYAPGNVSPVPLALTKRPVTKFLEAAMKRFIPESYSKRCRQEMDMEPSVPIFICTTAFPSVPCPLFVYEPRYRLMVRRAVESGEKQFGIVHPHSGKKRYYDYGCILDIRDCMLLGDGCSILSTVGCKRFKILTRHEKDGYETAKVEYIHDEAIPEEHLAYMTQMHDIVLEKASLWYESLAEDLKHEILQSYGEMPAVESNWETRDDGPAWAWWIIALLPLRQQLKVDILATTSLEKRLRAIEKTIHSMPGNCRYTRGLSASCNVAVVGRSAQLHDLDVVHPDDEDDEDVEDEEVDMIDNEEDDDDDVEEDVEEGDDNNVLGTGEEDGQNAPMQQADVLHDLVQSLDHDEEVDADAIDEEQNAHDQHSSQLAQSQHLQLHPQPRRHQRRQHHSHHHHHPHHRHHHHHHHHHRSHQAQPQHPAQLQHCNNVADLDEECCQCSPGLQQQQDNAPQPASLAASNNDHAHSLLL